VDLETLRHRVQTYYYDSLGDFCKDVKLLIRNAKDFNAPKSQAYQVRWKEELLLLLLLLVLLKERKI